HCAANETAAAALPHLERWLALEPFELRAHRALLDALLADGRVREAQAHFALAERLFESEGLDRGALHAAWRELRQRAGTAKAPVDIARACDPQAAKGPSGTAAPAAARRPSIAVMPFLDRSSERRAVSGSVGASLAHDVVTRLAKLRGVFVIAQGSASALH